MGSAESRGGNAALFSGFLDAVGWGQRWTHSITKDYGNSGKSQCLLEPEAKEPSAAGMIYKKADPIWRSGLGLRFILGWS